jgi:hypothetical protein
MRLRRATVCDAFVTFWREIAQWMAVANLVVLIDASREGEPGELRIRPLSLIAQSGAVGTHNTIPEELAGLTAVVYGQCPPIVIVSLTGADFSLGEHLSAIVAQRVPFVRAAVWQCVLTHSLLHWRETHDRS